MMTEKNKKVELGRELAQQRQAKELTVEQLSARTKIAVKNINHIENGVFDFLPSAYVKAYLSAIAVELGLDSGVILRKYYASLVKEVDGSLHESRPASVRRETPAPVVTEPLQIREQATVKAADKVEIVPVKEAEKAVIIQTKAADPVEITPINPPADEPEKAASEPEKKPAQSDIPPVPAKKSKAKAAKPDAEQIPPLQPAAEEKKPTPQPIEKPAPVKPVVKENVKPNKLPEYKSSSWFAEFVLVLRFYSVFIFGVLFLALALVVIFWIVPERQFKSSVAELKTLLPAQTPIARVDTLQQAPADTLQPGTRSTPVDSQPPQQQLKLLTLKIVVADSTWLRLVYNDSLAEEGIFAPGDEMTWHGYDRFYIRTGNAGSLRLLLDGKDLGALPQSGVITNIQIDPEGIKSIKKTQFPKAMGVSSN